MTVRRLAISRVRLINLHQVRSLGNPLDFFFFFFILIIYVRLTNFFSFCLFAELVFNSFFFLLHRVGVFFFF